MKDLNLKTPYSFKYYNPDEIIGNKSMREHLRFAMSYWHTLTADGTDQFGIGTMIRSWNNENDKMDLAKARMEAAFEFMDKLDLD